MRNRMKTISLIGATFYGNRGAEAMLSTCIGKIREKFPDADFHVFSYLPVDDSTIVIDPKINVWDSTPVSLVFFIFPLSILYRCVRRVKLFNRVFPSAIIALSKSDALLDISGVSFIEGRELFLPFNIFNMLPAVILSTPIIRMAQAIGPFNKTINRLTANIFLPKCRAIFSRGNTTLKSVSSLIGDNTSIHSEMVDDVAFLFKEEYSVTSDMSAFLIPMIEDWSKKIDKNTAGHIIGICPSSVVGKKAKSEGIDYSLLLQKIVCKLIDNGNYVVIFPNATRERSKNSERNNDLILIEKLRLNSESIEKDKDKIVFIDKDINTNGIKKIISHCDIIMTSRFHAMIASLTLVKPTIVIGWSHKYLEVMSRFDMEEYVIDYRGVTSNHIISVLNKIQMDKEITQMLIQKNLPKIIESSQRQFEFIYKFLGC